MVDRVGEERDSVDFMVKYKSWVSIKKMSILESTPPEEVAFQLAGIRQVIDRKAFELLGINVTTLDQLADSITAGKRKNWENLAEALQALGKPETKAAVESAAGKEEHKGFASTYLFRKVVQNLGFDFDINQEALSKVYPNLKVPKPPGRRKK